MKSYRYPSQTVINWSPRPSRFAKFHGLRDPLVSDFNHQESRFLKLSSIIFDRFGKEKSLLRITKTNNMNLIFFHIFECDVSYIYISNFTKNFENHGLAKPVITDCEGWYTKI